MAGRPKLNLDVTLIERLAGIHCTTKEIAAAMDCSTDTLERNFAALMAKGREKGKTSLRRIQWESAQKGNVTMQIWLGKQILGQAEPVKQTDQAISLAQPEEYGDILGKPVSEK